MYMCVSVCVCEYGCGWGVGLYVIVRILVATSYFLLKLREKGAI